MGTGSPGMDAMSPNQPPSSPGMTGPLGPTGQPVLASPGAGGPNPWMPEIFNDVPPMAPPPLPDFGGQSQTYQSPGQQIMQANPGQYPNQGYAPPRAAAPDLSPQGLMNRQYPNALPLVPGQNPNIAALMQFLQTGSMPG